MVPPPELNLQELKQKFDTDGYVVVPILSPEEVEQYRVVADKATDKTRTGNWKYMRVVGKQFPPFGDDYDNDIWGVQNIMRPDMGEEESALFRKAYCNQKLLEVVACLGDIEKSQLRLGLFNLLVNPVKKDDFGLSWHRDTIKPTATEEEELAALRDLRTAVQWNIALHDDECLYAVPKSHNRLRTPEERQATMCPTGNEPMPGAVPVKLKPGEGVFYNNQILHRGVYSKKIRRTLHGAHGTTFDSDKMVMGMLQHDLQWILDEKVGELFRKDAGTDGYDLWKRLKDASNQFDRKIEFAQDNI